MIAVYIILGIFALAILYIIIKYSLNSSKISKKSKKVAIKEEKVEKKDSKPADTTDKKEKESPNTVFYDESPKDAAMRKAFEESKQKEIGETVVVPTIVHSNFEDDGEMTELERALVESGRKTRFSRESNKIETKHLKSETNTIGHEGSNKTGIEQSSQKSSSNGNGQIDLSNMSDDVKKALIADIMNRKY